MSKILSSKLTKVRLAKYEGGLNFPGEIWMFSRREYPVQVFVAKVRSHFEQWVGGTHSDWIAGPDNLTGWKNADEALEKAVFKALDMRKKNLCHELPFGGVKFTICGGVPLIGEPRIHAYKLLGEALNFFRGEVFSGADVHTGDNDLMLTRGVSPYVLGL